MKEAITIQNWLACFYIFVIILALFYVAYQAGLYRGQEQCLKMITKILEEIQNEKLLHIRTVNSKQELLDALPKIVEEIKERKQMRK